MAQTSVTEYRARDIQGQIINPTEAVTEVRIVDDSDNITAGLTVVQSTADIDVALPDAAFTKAEFQGIAVWDGVDREKALSTGINTYEDDSPITLLLEGVTAVPVTDTVSKNGTVFFVHTTGGASTKHTYRSDLDTDKASEIPAYYLEDGTTGNLVRIRVSKKAGLGSLLT